MLTVVAPFFDGKPGAVPKKSLDTYTAVWVDRLYRAVRRNFTGDLRFVVATDAPCGAFEESQIEILRFLNFRHDWWACMEGLRVIGDPVMSLGLDTLIVGPLDEFEYFDGEFAMIRDPYNKNKYGNGVSMWRGRRGADLYDQFAADPDRKSPDYKLGGYNSEMIWMAKIGKPDAILDDQFPGKILSYKKDVRPQNSKTGDASIIYFHGEPKQHTLMDVALIRENWI